MGRKEDDINDETNELSPQQMRSLGESIEWLSCRRVRHCQSMSQ